MVYLCKFGENLSIGSKDILHTKTMTLKMGTRSPKTLHVLTLSQRYIHSSLMNNHPFSFLAIKATFVNRLVTLKIRSRSPKYSKSFRLSLRYTCASLVGIKTKMQEIYHF